jgi:hypothetical protein
MSMRPPISQSSSVSCNINDILDGKPKHVLAPPTAIGLLDHLQEEESEECLAEGLTCLVGDPLCQSFGPFPFFV